MLKSTLEGAQTTLYCVFSDDIVSGEYYANCEKTPTRADAHDLVIARRLWDYSTAVTCGVNY